MALTCRNISQLHNAFVDGELSPGLTAEVHAHLLQCPACQQQIEMLRAVGDVISKDHPIPQLDSGFAQRVVAAIPKNVLIPARRPFVWRLVTRASLPAVAASLLLMVVFWPQHRDSVKSPKVLGVSVYAPVIDPAVDAVSGTKKAAEDLTKLVKISIDQARADVKQGLEKAKAVEGKASRPVYVTDVLLMPFDEVLNPPVPPTNAEPNSTGSVRF